MQYAIMNSPNDTPKPKIRVSASLLEEFKQGAVVEQDSRWISTAITRTHVTVELIGEKRPTSHGRLYRIFEIRVDRTGEALIAVGTRIDEDGNVLKDIHRNHFVNIILGSIKATVS